MPETDERQDYWDDVRDTAAIIKMELLDRVKDGESGESLREWLIEHIDETIDGSGRVIYTWKAKMCLVYSKNEGAYFEEFGSEGAVEDGSINWSRLAYAAFMRDVQEELTSEGVNLNAPVPECDECGSEDQDERKYIASTEGGDGKFLCESCAEPEDEDEEDDDGESISTYCGSFTEQELHEHVMQCAVCYPDFEEYGPTCDTCPSDVVTYVNPHTHKPNIDGGYVCEDCDKKIKEERENAE